MTLPLQHTSRWITDADGRVVILHGLNVVPELDKNSPADVGFGAEDAAFIGSQGFNAVRLGLWMKRVQPKPGVFDETYLASIEQTVKQLAAAGVMTLIDFHQDGYSASVGGRGLPEWMVITDGIPDLQLPLPPELGFLYSFFLNLPFNRAVDNFWANRVGPDGIGLQDWYARGLRHVAERFGNLPSVLGYDLFNEPWPGTQAATCMLPLVGCPVFDRSMSGFIRRSITAIRAADPSTMIWYEPHVLFNFGVPTQLDHFDDPALGFSYHDYCMFVQFADLTTGCNVTDELVAQNAEARSKATGDALLLSEFGSGDDPAYILPMLERADHYKQSWLFWSYGPFLCFGTCEKTWLVQDAHLPPEGANLNEPLLRMLVRPYPRIVSGTPLSYDYDTASSRFTAQWTPNRVDGSGSFTAGSVSEFWISPRLYTNGYTVEVSGGTVISKLGAARLMISSLPDAAKLQLTVNPAP